ncbi:MAG: hypothetical protein RSC82_08130 [Oscillospiraceae bacterium]
MEEIYTVVGKCHGSFTDQATGNVIVYANLFVTAPFKEGKDNNNYHYEGEKCFTMKCTAMDVLKDVEVGQKVQLFFNQYKKVSYVVTAS